MASMHRRLHGDDGVAAALLPGGGGGVRGRAPDRRRWHAAAGAGGHGAVLGGQKEGGEWVGLGESDEGAGRVGAVDINRHLGICSGRKI